MPGYINAESCCRFTTLDVSSALLSFLKQHDECTSGAVLTTNIVPLIPIIIETFHVIICFR
jgi:hypothetical protein